MAASTPRRPTPRSPPGPRARGRRRARADLHVDRGRVDVRVPDRRRRVGRMHVARDATRPGRGAHTFDVRAIDRPATSTRPRRRLVDGDRRSTRRRRTRRSRRARPADTATPRRSTFTSTEAGRRSSAGSTAARWAACTSPKAYTGLADGTHTFDVRATDAAGNIDASPATATWTITTVDTTPPDTTITSGADRLDDRDPASFAFTSTEAGSTFECRIDGGAWGACTSPQAYSGLADGVAHVRRARDRRRRQHGRHAGVRRLDRDRAVDTTAPDTTITSGPTGLDDPTTASFAFTSTEAGDVRVPHRRRRLGACTSPKTYSGLATARTRSTCARPTRPATPTRRPLRAWTIAAPADTTAPDTSITAGPAGSARTTPAAARVHRLGGRLDVRVPPRRRRLGRLHVAQAYAALADGTHTFDVRATDAAGNTDATPATPRLDGRRVDTTAPDTTITAARPASTTGDHRVVRVHLDGGRLDVRVPPRRRRLARAPRQGDTGLRTAPTRSTCARPTGGQRGSRRRRPGPGRSWRPRRLRLAADTTAPDTNLTSGPTTVTASPARRSSSPHRDPGDLRVQPRRPGRRAARRRRGTRRCRAASTRSACGRPTPRGTPTRHRCRTAGRSCGAPTARRIRWSHCPAAREQRCRRASLEGACARVPSSASPPRRPSQRISVATYHRAIRISVKVRSSYSDGENATRPRELRSHGRGQLIASRRVHVRFTAASGQGAAPRRQAEGHGRRPLPLSFCPGSVAR